jgi:hypothetical protein
LPAIEGYALMNVVLRWLKTRAVVHVGIVTLFVLPMVGLLRIVPNDEEPYVSKVRIWFDSLEYAAIACSLAGRQKSIHNLFY